MNYFNFVLFVSVGIITITNDIFVIGLCPFQKFIQTHFTDLRLSIAEKVSPLSFKNLFNIDNSNEKRYTKPLNLKTLAFPEERDEKKKKDENNILHKNEIIYNSIYDLHRPIYRIVWYDCLQCKELLDTMNKMNKEYNYINIENYFFCTEINYKFNKKNIKPFFYRDDQFLGNDLIDIYSDIFPM